MEEIYYKNFVLGEYADYVGKYLAVLRRFQVEDTQLDTLVTEVETRHTKLNQNTNQLQSSTYTEDIRQADFIRDEAYLCLRYIVEGYSHHSDEDKKEAALYIISVLRAKGWGMQSMSYSKQSGITLSLLEEYNSNERLKAAFETLGQTQRVTALEAAQGSFEAVQGKRTDESASKPDINAGEIAKELHVELKKLTQYIVLFQSISPNSAYKEIAASLEEINDNTRALLKARKTRRENEKANKGVVSE